MTHPSLDELLGRRLQGRIASLNPLGYGFVELAGSPGMQFIFSWDSALDLPRATMPRSSSTRPAWSPP